MSIPERSSENMLREKSGQVVQGFTPDPEKCQVPVSINAAATSSLTVTGWTAVRFKSTADVRVYLNALTTKYLTFGGAEIHTLVIHPDVDTLVFSNAGAAAISVEVWGM